MTDANDILMGGGSGLPAWSFDAPGTRKVAKIVEPPTSRQEREYVPGAPGTGKPKFFPSGDPIMSVLVTVQTNEHDPSRENDDGKRTFFIEGKRLKTAVREAVQRTGATGLEVGGVLDVTLTHYEVEGDRKSGRNWQITYTPAAQASLMSEQPAPQAQHYQQPPTGQVYAAPPPQAAPAAPQLPQMSPQAMAEFQAWQQQQQAAQQAQQAPSYDEPPF